MLDIIKNLFLRKQQNIKDAKIASSVVIQVGGDLTLDSELSQLLDINKNDKILLNRLVKEKLEHAITLVIDGESKDAHCIIDTIYTASLKSISIENENLLSYLKALLCILENKIEQAESLIEYISNDDLFKQNIVNIINVEKNGIANITVANNLKEDALFSYVFLHVLFRKVEYDYIIAHFTPTDSSFHFHDFFYALASLNKYNYIEAIQSLDNAITKKSIPKYSFCKVLAQINLILSQIQEIEVDLDALDSLYRQLIELGDSCSEFRDLNPTIFYMTKLRALLILKSELFLDEYSTLTKEQKDDVNFRFQLGAYYQIQKRYQDAIDIYKEILSEEISCELPYRIMLCYLHKEEFIEVINFFEETDIHQTSATITIYLIAIHNQTPAKLDNLFDKFFYDECKNVDDLSFFLDLYKYSEHIKNTLYSKTKEFKTQILSATKTQKILFAFFAAEMSDVESSKIFLASVNEYSSNDLEMAYFQLSQLADCNLRKIVAKWFVDNNLKTFKILSILAECYMNEKKYSSSFALLQESFLLHKEKGTAVNLINLAALIDNVKISDVQEYFDFVSTNKEPLVLMIAAQTYCKFGFYDKAEMLSYEATFLLNNRDDIELFKMYLSIHFKMLGGNSENNINFDRVSNNVVVNLVPLETNKTEECVPLTICINQEAEFCNNANVNGALHISKSNLLYLKLVNKEIHDTIEYNGSSYTIDSIISKYVFFFRHILAKVEDSSDDFLLKKIYVDVNKDVRQQMQEVLRELGPSSNLLDLYHYKDNPLGLPIECINRCGYDDYVQIVQFLLYAKDEVLYAGLNYIPFDFNRTYTITLSTLVVLKVLDNLSLLEQFYSKIYISDTLLNFIKERSESASKTLVVSPGKLGLDEDGGLILTPPDKSMPDFWNSIYEVALCFNICNISSSDRSEFDKAYPDIDVEKLFIETNVHFCQLDSFIVAKKNSTFLLLDDLFFRHLGTPFGIQSVNHTHLYSIMNHETLKTMIKKLMDTNYIYIPVIPADDSHVSEYVKSISSNDRKRKAYAELMPPNSLLKAFLSR